MKIAIVTDSAADISSDITNRSELRILEIPLTFENKTLYQDQLSESGKLSEMLANGTGILTEEPVTLSEISKIFTSLVSTGYTEIICIHIANSISGLGSNLRNFVDNEQSFVNIHLFDSQSFGKAEGLLVESALSMAEQGFSCVDIMAQLRLQRQKLHTVIIMENLQNLRKTGSISSGTHHLGKLVIHYKSLLHFSKTGKLEFLDNSARTKKLLGLVTNYVKNTSHTSQRQCQLSIMSDDPQMLEDSTASLRQTFQLAQLHSEFLQPAIMAYTGPKTPVFTWQAE